MSAFGFFWLGGIVATILVLAAERYANGELPEHVAKEFRDHPFQFGMSIVLTLLTWPAFIIYLGIARKQNLEKVEWFDDEEGEP